MFVVKIVEIVNVQISWLVQHFFVIDAVIVASVLAYRETTLQRNTIEQKRIKRENGKQKFMASSTASTRRHEMKLEVMTSLDSLF